ncbi:helix-turn-helix domain-containing protein [Yoonia litorea]|uniref:Transcriptional regulator, contains XRE-family HTH domain n=1 Tax=Yoonia litorea TaxID=1123755 RepID=A0A1I6MI01_9RHOB|nr:helix-turn-helix domain-containing protein [Yoonia litorea]SFS15345.1 Transcriptional regulator, contains XRE-family HTH domain [Yoonia litorea]
MSKSHLQPAESEADAYTYVGRELRKLRLERGMTQAQVAEIISVSPQQYQKYEDAQSKCSLNNLIALADHYGTSLSRFLPGSADENEKSPEPIENEADLLARLVTAFVSLDDGPEKLRLVQLVEAIGAAKQRPYKDEVE